MLTWADGYRWSLDNNWQPMETVPTRRTVDVWAKRWANYDGEHRLGFKRHHGCTFDGEAWDGLPEGCVPMLWAEPMPIRRKRAA